MRSIRDGSSSHGGLSAFKNRDLADARRAGDGTDIARLARNSFAGPETSPLKSMPSPSRSMNEPMHMPRPSASSSRLLGLSQQISSPHSQARPLSLATRIRTPRWESTASSLSSSTDRDGLSRAGNRQLKPALHRLASLGPATIPPQNPHRPAHQDWWQQQGSHTRTQSGTSRMSSSEQ